MIGDISSVGHVNIAEDSDGKIEVVFECAVESVVAGVLGRAETDVRLVVVVRTLGGLVAMLSDGVPVKVVSVTWMMV